MLRTAFERFGHVASVHMPIEAGSGKPRGIAFVSMPRLDDADEAIIRMNGASLCGRPVVVNVAQDKVRPQRSAVASKFHLL